MPSFLLPSLFSLVAITIILVAKTATVVESEPDLSFVSSFCGRHHDDDPPRMRDRASYLTDGAALNGYPGEPGLCVTANGGPCMFAYSLCPETVSYDDCKSCLSYARSQLLDVYCKDRYGAQLTLVGCFMRYETYRFCNSPE